MEIKNDSTLPLRDKELHVKIKDRPYHMNVIILTDTGMQISKLVGVEGKRPNLGPGLIWLR